MQINEAAPVVARDHVTVKAPIEKIWRLLSDVDHCSDWNSAVTSAHLEGAFKSGVAFRWKAGATTIVSTLEQIEPMTRLVWTGRFPGTRAIHAWTFTDGNDGVVVATSESFEGWLVRLLRKTMQRTLDRTLATWLKALKERAEEPSR